jgi:hypothetical protein
MKEYHRRFSDREYKELMTRMEDMTRSIKQLNESVELYVYTSKEVCKRLGISETLLTQYRNERQLSFSRVGDKFFYTDEDIEKFIENTSSRTFTI